MDNYVKIYVFIPKNDADKVRLALGKAGIGKMGNYDHCSFVSEGKGYFRPQGGANPAIGSIGNIEEVEEIKLEFVCLKSEIDKVLEVVKKYHPYEEVALDVIPLLDFPSINNPNA
ncbi:MAG: YqfO family protein [Candidatus Berkelbacteria bacterium]|nr:YqfO family protein [Candidatus Berkelbacteria bacterium]